MITEISCAADDFLANYKTLLQGGVSHVNLTTWPTLKTEIIECDGKMIFKSVTAVENGDCGVSFVLEDDELPDLNSMKEDMKEDVREEFEIMLEDKWPDVKLVFPPVQRGHILFLES